MSKSDNVSNRKSKEMQDRKDSDGGLILSTEPPIVQKAIVQDSDGGLILPPEPPIVRRAIVHPYQGGTFEKAQISSSLWSQDSPTIMEPNFSKGEITTSKTPIAQDILRPKLVESKPIILPDYNMSSLNLAPAPYCIAGTQFISQTPKDQLWKEIKYFLNEQKMVDYEIGSGDPNAQEITGVQVISAVFHSSPGDFGGGSAQFNVQIFSQEKDDQFLVEIQLRSGCRWAFQTIYRQMRSTLQEHLMNNPSSPRSATPSDMNLSSITLDDDTFNCIYDMADSEMVDIAQEGMNSLAEFSYSKENRTFLKKKEHVVKLISLIGKTLNPKVGDYVTQRCSTVLAANFSVEDEFKLRLLDVKDKLMAINSSNGISGRGDEYDKIYRLFLKDMKRQVQITLGNLETK